MEQKIDKISDEQLVYMINDGNEDAKDLLYKRFNKLINSELKSVKRSACALRIEWQDLVQEAMVGFANSISSFNQSSDAKFSTYATLCIRRKLLNIIKKNSTSKSHAAKTALSINDDGSNIYFMNMEEATNKEPLNKMIIEESLDEIKKVISTKLTKEEQEILDYATKGIKPEIIAKHTGKNVKQVYNILHRTRKKIKNI